MKKYFEQIKGWVLFWLSASITIIIFSAIAYAAWSRSTISPTTITWDAALYSNSDNTLTATKWNELVNTIKWRTISTSDTTPFNINCERRMTSISPSIITFYADYVSPGQIVTYANTSWTFRDVLNTNKGAFSHWNWFTLSWLQYRCPTN